MLEDSSMCGFEPEKVYELFSKIPHLRSLGVAHNSMIDDEVALVMMALECCTELEKLDVGGNFFGRSFLNSLMKSVSEKHFTLTHLNMAGVCLTC
jgi:Ran GTPase-activating protein (RanGAP) involved in mRNA processing and transport